MNIYKMPTPSIGFPISMYDIQTEFGGTNPIGIDEYYQNAVPSYTLGVTGIPSIINSIISLDMFYSKSKPIESVAMILNTGAIYGNGQVGIANGITALKNLTITGFDFKAQYTGNGATGDISIYYRTGLITDSNILSNTSLWILSGTTNITYTGNLQQIPITTSIKVPANTNITFLIIFPPTLSYSNGTALGQTFASNSDMNVNSGYGLSSFPIGSSFQPRNFQGNIRYTIP